MPAMAPGSARSRDTATHVRTRPDRRAADEAGGALLPRQTSAAHGLLHEPAGMRVQHRPRQLSASRDALVEELLGGHRRSPPADPDCGDVDIDFGGECAEPGRPLILLTGHLDVAGPLAELVVLDTQEPIAHPLVEQSGGSTEPTDHDGLPSGHRGRSRSASTSRRIACRTTNDRDRSSRAASASKRSSCSRSTVAPK
jgi:hypothetical protein